MDGLLLDVKAKERLKRQNSNNQAGIPEAQRLHVVAESTTPRLVVNRRQKRPHIADDSERRDDRRYRHHRIAESWPGRHAQTIAHPKRRLALSVVVSGVIEKRIVRNHNHYAIESFTAAE